MSCQCLPNAIGTGFGSNHKIHPGNIEKFNPHDNQCDPTNGRHGFDPGMITTGP